MFSSGDRTVSSTGITVENLLKWRTDSSTIQFHRILRRAAVFARYSPILYGEDKFCRLACTNQVMENRLYPLPGVDR